MTLYEVIRGLEKVAKTHPLVKIADDGSIYDICNTAGIEYGAFIVTQNTHRQTEQFDYYGLTLFYVDRLIGKNMEDNRLEIQSFAKQLLGNVIHVFCDEYDIDLPQTITYQPFTQKFLDETAGQYAQFELEIPIDIMCAEEFE